MLNICPSSWWSWLLQVPTCATFLQSDTDKVRSTVGLCPQPTRAIAGKLELELVHKTLSVCYLVTVQNSLFPFWCSWTNLPFSSWFRLMPLKWYEFTPLWFTACAGIYNSAFFIARQHIPSCMQSAILLWQIRHILQWITQFYYSVTHNADCRIQVTK